MYNIMKKSENVFLVSINLLSDMGLIISNEYNRSKRDIYRYSEGYLYLPIVMTIVSTLEG